VFDDSITTGSRAQSAAAALRMAGAQVVGILAVGRAVGGVPADRRPSVAAPSRLG
jgi:orotate phosphoribosyltransferase